MSPRRASRRRLVVVGNGMAGARLVENVVHHAPERFDITVIGAEPGGSYNRILLSGVLAGDRSPTEIVTHETDWYAANGVGLRAGEAAIAIDRAQRTVATDAGAAVPYDALVLATGSHPIILPVPGATLEGVVTFRDLRDVRRMVVASGAGGRAVVIGGGLLGLEAAEGLRRRGMAVTVVHLMPFLMERQLDEPAAALLRESLAQRGVAVVLSAETMAVTGAARASGVSLKDGRSLPADLVVMAVGIHPNADLARAAGLTCRRGVLVDDGLGTSDPAVFAIGECVEHRGRSYGLLGPIWEQAQVLAGRLAESDEATYPGSAVATSLKVTGIDVYSVGEFAMTAGSEEIVLEDCGRGAYRKLVIEQDRLRGAVLYGDVADGGWYFELIRAGGAIGTMRDGLIFGRTFARRAGDDKRPPPLGVAEVAAS
ncbi:MAG: NAD(P)/FAD-dependent oxidoreductase [Proteobacteria bacterium]|nr:NAD(P)/FAD-dependent oxidoreductase [Pseudomonadota bacterium]